MRENSENICWETEAAFALAVLLLNFVILIAVIGIIWSLQLLLLPINLLNAAPSETIWR